MYHRGCILLVNSLRCWRRCSVPTPRSIHISADRLLTVWADLISIVWVVPLGRHFESSCGCIFPVPRPVSSIVYSLGRLFTLLALVLRSFSSIHKYICGCIVDYLIRPSSHSWSGTFEEEYWIFLWSYSSCPNICIIEGVLSFSISYIVYIGDPLLSLDLYIHLRADCLLSDPTLQPWFKWDLQGGVLHIPMVVLCPYQYLYHQFCTLLVNLMYCSCRCFYPSLPYKYIMSSSK